MRPRPLILAFAGLTFLGGVVRAQTQSAPLESFQGTASQTTTAFQMPDSCEIRWRAVRNLNVSVLAADGSVVGGGAGARGAFYLQKGGNYHLQLDYDPMPQVPSPSQSNSPQSPNPSAAFTAFMNKPYEVDVVPASVAPAPDGTPFFKLPSGATATASSQPGAVPASASVTPVSATTPAPASSAAPGPAVNLTQDQARAVVLVKGDMAEGTGFLVQTKDGPAVITNQHVISNNPNVKLTTSNGLTIQTIACKAATDRDLAMFTIKDAGYSYLPLATDVTAVSPGDQVVTPGNSEGGEVMLNTTGKVLALGPDRVEIDNTIYHGNSGGPVFDTKMGKVIGVVTEALKVDTTDALDKASFASRNSAIQNSMRYFALRVDNVPQWEDINLNSFEGETAFLDKFDQRSKCLDSFLNSPSPSDNSNGQQQQQSGDQSQNNEAANLWRQDKAITRANDQFEDNSGGNVDTSQQMDALRELLGSIVDAANTDVTTIQNQNNFYTYDRQRAKEEMEYRQEIRDELDGISNNISRLGGLPRKN